MRASTNENDQLKPDIRFVCLTWSTEYIDVICRLEQEKGVT